MELGSDPLKTPIRTKRQWRSGSNSEPKTEESRWESFSPEQNYLIQKAFYDKRTEIDIGESIISLQDMIQRSKVNITSQKPLRRVDCEEEEEIDTRSERYFETELPKSINNIFGTLEHFISFFSRRNQDILDLTKQFQEFEQSNNLGGLNTKTCPRLISCLEKELLQPIEDHLKDGSISESEKKSLRKRKRRHEELVTLFKKEFLSFEEFYSLILRSYTMSTDLYLNLNKYLRNESWTAVDNLLLYAICLCKAFFNLTPSEQSCCSMTLFRGTALNEEALSCYQIHQTPKYFSWNSVTSTSTNKKIAESFMYMSSDVGNKKYPVMFIIEVPSLSTSRPEYLKWIDIHKYSAQPKEDEVILPPGSVFELEQISTDQEKRTIIKIKLRHDIESLAHGGLIMQGAFQSQMMNDKQITIMCLGGEELSEALKSIAGNQLIAKIEFCLCEFNNKALEELLYISPTLKQAKALKFICCKYNDEPVSLINVNSCNIVKIEMSDVQDFEKIFSLPNIYWAALRKLKLDLRNLKNIKVKETNDFVAQRLGYFTQLNSLTLHFRDCSILTENVNILASQALKHLTQLTSLTLDFYYCCSITNEAMNNLASQGLKSLTQLTSLNIDFSYCSEISDEGVNSLTSEALQYLTQLTTFTLDFSFCNHITDHGIENLASEALKYLTQLTSLTLKFSDCSEITDKGMNDLASQVFKYLSKLTSLNLDFSYCSKISDEKVYQLASPALESIVKLAFLMLNQNIIKNTTECYLKKKQEEDVPDCLFLKLARPKSLENNSQQIPPFEAEEKFIKSVIFEMLKLADPKTITTTPSETLFKSCHLTSLTLDLTSFKITDEDVYNLSSQVLKHLPQLTALTLNFHGLDHFTNESMNSLAIEGLQYLTQLTSLALNFSRCSEITDVGLNNLTSQGLKPLINLTSLSLNFSCCRQITDEGVNNLSFQALKHLTDLTHLDLDFSHCLQITDEGVNSLIYHGIKHFPNLRSLILNFSRCSITKFTISNIMRVLRYFGFILEEKIQLVIDT